MKHLLYTASLLMVVMFTACEDYLDTPAKSSLEVANIFSDPDLAQGAIDGIKYAFTETNSHRGRFVPYYGFNTDIEFHYNSDEGEYGKIGPALTYCATPELSYMNTTNNAWAMMYQGIERANQCIEGLKEYGDIETESKLSYLYGEAISLRAILYGDLLKAWGDIVYRFEPLANDTVYKSKTSRDVIYKQLIADLEEAQQYVPWPGESSYTSTVETTNKAFLKAYRAKLCMIAAGYSQYPDGIRQSNDPELSVETLYPIALQECKDIIEQEGTYVTFEPEYEDIFKKNCQDNIDAGGESFWEIPWSNSRGRYVSSHGVRHDDKDQWTDYAGAGGSGPNPQMYYDYDTKDKRRDVSICPYKWGKATDGIAQQELTELNKMYFGKLRYEWMDRIVTGSDDGVNKCYMRYGEVILMAAELENELNGPSAAAPYLKKLRERAFDEADWPEKVEAYVDGLTTKEEMFNAIVDEQAYEFCGEMTRKQALIRWNLLGSKIDEAKTKMYALRDRTGEYADVPQNVYYNYASDGYTLETYGLNRGETDDMSSSYDYKKDFVNAEDLDDERIELLYFNDPDTKQFWPIWQVFISASNETLWNDYGY